MSKIEIKNLNEEGGNSLLVTPYTEADNEKIAADGDEKVIAPGTSHEFEVEVGSSGIDIQDVGQDAAQAGEEDEGDADGDEGEGDDSDAGEDADDGDQAGEGAGEPEKAAA
jgi:hypothetical protein